MSTILALGLLLFVGCGEPRVPVPVPESESELEGPSAIETLKPSLTTDHELPFNRLPSGNDFLVLKERVDYARLAALIERAGWAKDKRRRAVPDFLRWVSRRAQKDLLEHLEELKAGGAKLDFYPLDIVNWIGIRGDHALITELATRPEVAGLIPARSLEVTRWPPSPHAPIHYKPSDPTGTAWALEALKVRAARERGLTGKGVLVASCDTGVNGSLSALKDGFRAGGFLAPMGAGDKPVDPVGHGTAVLALAVGRTKQLGVAPGAQWVAALANPSNRSQAFALTGALDFLLQQRPDLLIMAFGGRPSECQEAYRPLINAFLAAEILPVMAAGNEGPGLGTDITPANLTGLYPGDASGFAVGALLPDGRSYVHSGRGPRTCGLTAPYPTVAAPGTDLRSIDLSGRPLGLTGTSGSTGLVAGVAALLLEARPSLTVIELRQILIESARDVGPEGVDDATGYGAVDVERALALLDAL